MTRRGRKSIFAGKMAAIQAGDTRQRVQGWLTVPGVHAFERAKRQLRTLYRGVVGKQPASISDGETIEFLARGVDDTLKVLRDEVLAAHD